MEDKGENFKCLVQIFSIREGQLRLSHTCLYEE